jgi:hypothetical protein
VSSGRVSQPRRAGIESSSPTPCFGSNTRSVGFFSGLGLLRYLAFLGFGVAYLVMGHLAGKIVGGVVVAILVVPVAVSLGRRYAKRLAKPS